MRGPILYSSGPLSLVVKDLRKLNYLKYDTPTNQIYEL